MRCTWVVVGLGGLNKVGHPKRTEPSLKRIGCAVPNEGKVFLGARLIGQGPAQVNKQWLGTKQKYESRRISREVSSDAPEEIKRTVAPHE